MDFMSLHEVCDTDLSFPERLHSLSTEEILNVWASTQALSLFLQDSLLPAPLQVQSQTETHIIMELMRRDLSSLKVQGVSCDCADPEDLQALHTTR